MGSREIPLACLSPFCSGSTCPKSCRWYVEKIEEKKKIRVVQNGKQFTLKDWQEVLKNGSI